MNVEHVDFISVPVTDLERLDRVVPRHARPAADRRGRLPRVQARRQRLPLPDRPDGDRRRVHAGRMASPIALRVADVAETRKELEANGVEFAGETLRHRRLPHGARSTIPTATASCSTGGTRRMIEVQRTDFVAVPVQDRERAAKFYGETLGLTQEPELDRDVDRVRDRQRDARARQPRDARRRVRAAADRRRSCCASPDVARREAKLEAAGVEFLGEPWDSGVCHGAVVHGPRGQRPRACTTATRRISTGRRRDGGHARRLHPRPGGRHRGREAVLRRDARAAAERAPRPRRLDRVRGRRTSRSR